MKSMTIRRFAILVILVAVTGFPVRSQKRARPDMPPEHLTWREGEPFADSFLSEGVTIRIIRNKNLTVAAVCYEYKDYLACEVTVINKSEKRVDVIPNDFFLAGTYEN